MRTLKRNKQDMWYALYKGEKPIYERNEDGTIKYFTDSEGNTYPLETGETENSYYKPVQFESNISFGGGETQAREFGIDESEYSAVILTDKDEFPIKNDTVFWYETEPDPIEIPDGNFDMRPCDYTVAKISPSLNQSKYALKKNVK